IICRHGCPRTLLSDQGRSFCNEIVDALCEIMTIHHQLTAAYHPKTNGLTERFNKTLCSTLAKLVGDYKTTWDTLLPVALFAYYTLPNHTTKYDPFFLTYSRYANLPIDLQLQKEKILEEPLELSLSYILEKSQSNYTTKTTSPKEYSKSAKEAEKISR
ncbi:13614_t:CDS:1, partial [Gigaspora rosea]